MASRWRYFGGWLAVMVLLASCSGGDTAPVVQNPRVISGTALTHTKQPYTGTAEAVYISSNRTRTTTRVGTITADGQLETALPGTLPARLLTRLGDATSNTQNTFLPGSCNQ
ncbi:MAG: hypothetical protein AAF708_09875 [Deinococcota bacterium]